MKKIIAIILASLLVIPLGLVFVSAAETNIAAGKSYTFTGKYTNPETGVVSYPDTDDKELTDGVIGTKDDVGYGSPIWVGLNWKGENTIVNTEKWDETTISINSITVDLGSVKDKLTRFVVYAEDCGSGINKPKSVKIYISNDGTNFTSVGTAAETLFVDAEIAANPTFGIYAYTVALTAAVEARYVKYEITHGGAWTFVSEVEVYQDPNATPAEPIVVDEEITIDGILDDTGWAANNWTRVDSSNGKWQSAIKEGEERTDNYDFQFRSDDTNLYFGFKLNQKPLGTETWNGNGKGTNLRLWMHTDDEFVAYTHFLNIAFKAGEIVVTCHKNTDKEGNSAVIDEWAGLDVKSTDGANYWFVEAKIPFAAFGATDSAKFYISLSTPTVIDEAVETGKLQPTNNALTYGSYSGTEQNRNANAPYANWDKDADIDIVFADVKLGTVIVTPPPIDPPKDPDIDMDELMGDPIDNPAYELVVTAPLNYKPGEKIKVSITIKDIVPESGIGYLQFMLYYNEDMVEPVIKNSGENAAMDKFLISAPSKEAWEGICKLEEDDSRYNICFVTTDADAHAKEDGSVVIEIEFEVKSSATGTIAFWIPHAESEVLNYDLESFFGNGDYALVAEEATSSEPPVSSSTDTSTPGGPGDAGMVALVIVALIALAGATTVAVGKRRR